MDTDKTITAETKMDASELLAAMRLGNSAKLKLKFRDVSVPVKLLTTNEEMESIIRAKRNAREKSSGDNEAYEMYKSSYIMKAVLKRASSIDGLVGFTDQDLDAMNGDELTYLYDQYVTICKVIDINFDALTRDEIQGILVNIKKKTSTTKDLFTWQLAAIGKFFLTEIVPNLPEDNVAG